MTDAGIDRSDHGFVEQWRRVGPRLEQIRREELRNLDHETASDAIDALLQIGWQFRTERTTSGLVQLQEFFQRHRS